jgi:hypothetical protein
LKTPEARAKLWDELSSFFAEDDGSLPEVRLVRLSPTGLVRIFEELRQRAEPLDSSETVWHDERQEEVTLGEVPELPALVADEKISSVHLLLRGIRSGDLNLPDLGVFAASGEIALDYRMGDEWNEDVLAAFVELLADLRQLDPGGELDLEEGLPRGVRRHFRRAVQKYLAAAE